MVSDLHRNIWEAYTKSWSITDISERLKLFRECLDPVCVYSDPITQTKGYSQLSDYISGLHQNIPGVTFVTTDFKSHHDRSLAQWNMLDGEGNILSQGASYGVYMVDGRLLQMNGFFDLPA